MDNTHIGVYLSRDPEPPSRRQRRTEEFRGPLLQGGSRLKGSWQEKSGNCRKSVGEPWPITLSHPLPPSRKYQGSTSFEATPPPLLSFSMAQFYPRSDLSYQTSINIPSPIEETTSSIPKHWLKIRQPACNDTNSEEGCWNTGENLSVTFDHKGKTVET